MKEKIIKLWKWLRKNLINKQMFIFTLLGEAIFWSPVIVTSILAIIVDPWWWTATITIILFWAGPFTPGIPLQIALIFALKKTHQKIIKKRRVKINGTYN